MVKKHYYKLLKEFPSDHMISLSRLCLLADISDQTVDKIISCSSSQEANETILEYLILDIKNDNNLFDFCDALEKIVGKDSATLESLRSGKMFVHKQINIYINIYNKYKYIHI